MPDPNPTSKDDLRKRLRRVLAGVPPQKWAQASYEATRGLLEAISLAKGSHQADVTAQSGPKTIMFYMPTPREVDIAAAATACLKQGHTVCLPTTDWEGGKMVPAQIDTWGEALVETRHGIFEPPASARTIDLARIDVVVVPGLAFDRSGGRLGKGGGFYDRFLSQAGLRAAKVGVGLDEQVVDLVPRDAWDVGLDALVTPTRTLVFEPRRMGGG